METHSSILAWRIPWTGAWRATVHGVAKHQTRLSKPSHICDMHINICIKYMHICNTSYIYSLSLEKERCKTFYVYGTSRDLISNHLLLPSPESERVTADQLKTDVRGAFNLLRVCVQSLQFCLTLRPYGAHQAPLSIGFSQARILEWVPISFSRGSS